MEGEEDTACQNIRVDIARGASSTYKQDERGLILRIAPLENAVQVFMHVSL